MVDGTPLRVIKVSLLQYSLPDDNRDMFVFYCKHAY